MGTGHVFKSTDATKKFTDITGHLPDVPQLRAGTPGQLVVATDLGMYESLDTNGYN